MPHLRNDETDLERGSDTSQIEVPKSNSSKTRLSPPLPRSCELCLRWACPSTSGLNQNFRNKSILLPLQHFPYPLTHQIFRFYLHNSLASFPALHFHHHTDAPLFLEFHCDLLALPCSTSPHSGPSFSQLLRKIPATKP